VTARDADRTEAARAADTAPDPKLPAVATIATTLLIAAVLLPFLVKGFVVFQLTQALIYAIAILGLNLLTGVNGQFSLGHGAFFAIGAYAAAIGIDSFGIGYAWTLPLAGLIGFAAGFLFGLPALRLEGIYLALATFALAVATPQILKLSILAEWTGGTGGMSIAKPRTPPGLPLSDDQWLYFLTLAVAVACYWTARNLVHSRSGRALIAIREHPLAASAAGVNVHLYKSLAFGVSASYAGVAGALSAIVVQFVAPDSFTFTLSIALFVGLVVGGAGWLPGALVGGLVIVFVPNLAEGVSKGLSGAVYGGMLILLVYLMPEGAGGFVRRLAGFLAGRRTGP
jgi:branched-chain amino acid transport system permease protein